MAIELAHPRYLEPETPYAMRAQGFGGAVALGVAGLVFAGAMAAVEAWILAAVAGVFAVVVLASVVMTPVQLFRDHMVVRARGFGIVAREIAYHDVVDVAIVNTARFRVPELVLVGGEKLRIRRLAASRWGASGLECAQRWQLSIMARIRRTSHWH
jgi:hypothetical protein